MKIFLILTLVSLIVAKSQCCDNCLPSTALLEEQDIAESLEVLNFKSFIFPIKDSPPVDFCMNKPISIL